MNSILTPWLAAGQNISYPRTNWHKYDLADEREVDGRVFRNDHVNNEGDNYILARKIAAESTVYASSGLCYDLSSLAVDS